MSTVSGPDASQRAGDADVIRRNREEAKTRETDLIKKQAREVRRLNESHYGEVERLKQDHEAQIDDLHKETQSEISAHDHRHLKDMEDIRALHRKEVQRLASDNAKREQAFRTATDDSTATAKHQDDRFKQLSSDYESKSRALSEHFDEAMETSREAQSQALDNQRTKLTQAHDAETKDMRGESRAKIEDLTNQYSKYRTLTGQERQTSELHHLQENRKSADDLLHAVKRERLARNDSENNLREGFSTSLHETRAKFQRALDADEKAMDEAERDRAASANDRIENQVRRLQTENRDLREAQVAQRVKSGNANKDEMRNLRDDFQKNVDNYREQRDEAVRQSSAQSARDVASVRKDLEGQLADRARSTQLEKEEQSRLYRQSFNSLKDDFANRADAGKSNVDERIRHVVDETNEEKTRLQEQQVENHAASQRLKQDEMKKLREAFEDDKNEAVGRVQEQMRKLETAHTEKVNLIVGKYEKQVQQLKDQLVREKKAGEDNSKRLTEEMARVHKMEVDQVEAKNRAKVRELGDQHREEMRALNQRHEEKLDQVIGEMKRT